jgi:hypothetical protein
MMLSKTSLISTTFPLFYIAVVLSNTAKAARSTSIDIPSSW